MIFNYENVVLMHQKVSFEFSTQLAFRCIGILLVIGTLTISQYSFAESQLIEVKDMQLDSEERAKIVTEEVSLKLETNFDSGMKAIRLYYNPKFQDLGVDLVRLAWRYARNSQSAHVRQEVVQFLVEAAHADSEYIVSNASRFLLDFSSADFNPAAIELLSSFTYQEDLARDIIRVVGVANLRFESVRLRQVAELDHEDKTSHALYASKQWAALLVLSRFGEASSINKVLEQVKIEEDIILRAGTLFNDLVYTQQPLSFDCLRDFLRSRERLPPLKRTRPGTLESLYAAETLCKHIDNFPIIGCRILEDDLPKIIQWADAQKQWIIHK